MEEWRDVDGTQGMIQVSNEGRVRSLLRGKPFVLKAQSDNKGYQRISVTINRQKMRFRVHRIVAAAFIPNPNNEPQVNHIDGNKKNNSADNLEWVSNVENAAHAMRTGLWKNNLEASNRTNNSRKKEVIAYKDGQTMRFESVSAAERHFNSRHISDVLKNKRQSVAGWHFAYAREVV